MPFYFIGGEDHDFQKIGTCTVDTVTTAARRTAFARCALSVSGSATDGWQGQLASAQSSFWFSVRYYTNGPVATVEDILCFLDGSVRRLVLTGDGVSRFRFVKRDAASTSTTLATASVSMPSNTLVKLDVRVVYGTSGSVDLYQDGTLLLSYSGDVTTNSATSLSGFVLGSSRHSISSALWSEVICSSNDTRSLALVTLPPLANGNAFTFTTGTTTNLDEVTTDDADLATSATAGQIAQSTVTSSGITGNPIIHAVAVSARAQKGTTGPSKADLGVRTASTDYWSADINLPVSLNRISNTWETNPNTFNPWLYTDLTAVGFNIGLKSVT